MLLLWVKVFDWLRLFEKTAFYVRLIIETIYDVRIFIFVFFIACFAIGQPMYMLQLNKKSGDEDIIGPVTGHFAFDSLYNQYMLSLGEFAMDGFDNHPEMALCYLLFFISTFSTQITFLNMLITIMGDTYGRVMENKAFNARVTKLEIMSELTDVIKDRTKV